MQVTLFKHTIVMQDTSFKLHFHATNQIQWFAGCLSKYQEIGVFRFQPQKLICMLHNTILVPHVQLFQVVSYVQRAEHC